MDNFAIIKADKTHAEAIENICIAMWKQAYKDVFPKEVFDAMESNKSEKIKKTHSYHACVCVVCRNMHDRHGNKRSTGGGI